MTDQLPYKEIVETVKTLKETPQDYSALLTLAKFINEHFESPITHGPEYGQLEVMIPSFQELQPWAKDYVTPYTTFEEIAHHYAKSATKNDLEAEALHYIVMCFKPGTHERHCHLGKTPTDARPDPYPHASKKAFQKLHKKYSSSSWAKKTPYYYGN